MSTIMRITSRGYEILKESYDDLESIKKELTVQPYSSIPEQQQDPFPVYSEDSDYIIVPKYWGIRKFGTPSDINVPDGKNINIEFKGNLTEKQLEIQVECINKINSYGGGILQLPCGSGKTVLALSLMCHYKKKTLVTVTRGFLMNQWIERCNEFTNAKIGKLQQNIIDIEDKDIVIAMLPSLAKGKYDLSIFDEFGIVFADEGQHCASRYFSRALPIISCKRFIALSATPNRQDKLEKVLHWYFGDMLYVENMAAHRLTKIIPKFFNCSDKEYTEKYRKSYKKSGMSIDHASTLTSISQCHTRNNYIIELLRDILEDKLRKIIVLSDRINQLTSLNEMMNNENTSLYIGKMKQSELKKAEQARVIFASYSMASEGLDIKELNTLVFATSRKDESSIEQSIGRILRHIQHDCPPLIYDIVDELLCFKCQWRCRKRLYKKININIENISEDELDDFNNTELIQFLPRK
jgi:superfamily II DNA or RNA helicase